MKIGEKRGQVWIETVIYTLIGLAIIGLVLAGALPKINEKKDEMIIGRSIEAISNIDDKIYEVSRAAGSRRVVNLDIKNGVFSIDPSTDTISWVLDSSFEYSQVGSTVPFGNINVTTKAKGGEYEVTLELGYAMDLTYDGADSGVKQFNIAPTPYRLVIENKGTNPGTGDILVDFLSA